MIVKCSGRIERWWTWGSGSRGGTVRAPASVLMFLSDLDVAHDINLLVFGLAGASLVLEQVELRLLLEGRVVDPVLPRVGLPLLGHETARHRRGFDSLLRRRLLQLAVATPVPAAGVYVWRVQPC